LQLRKRLLMLLSTLLLTILCCEVGYAYTHPDCIDGKQHEFESHILILNSEESEGQVENVCILCGYTYIEYLPATGHHYGEWKVVEERPDSGIRIERRECQGCHREELRTVRINPLLPDSDSGSAQEEEYGINRMDFALSASIGGIWGGTVAVLWYNGLVLNWYKRESAKALKRR